VDVRDWTHFIASLTREGGTLTSKIWAKYLRPEQVALLRPNGRETRNNAPLSEYVNEPQEKLEGLSVKQYLDAHVWPRILSDPEFYPTFREPIEAMSSFAQEPLKSRYDSLWRHYAGMAILRRDGTAYALQSVRPGTDPVEQRWTQFEWVIVQRFHAELLGLIFDGIVTPTYHEDMVDPRIVTPGRFWRDVYRYDPAGNGIGWVRCTFEGTMEFTADALLVLKKDDRGRPLRACQVVYEPGGKRMRLTKRIANYTYRGPDDWRGRFEFDGPMVGDE
jgi:hypothetical protein